MGVKMNKPPYRSNSLHYVKHCFSYLYTFIRMDTTVRYRYLGFEQTTCIRYELGDENYSYITTSFTNKGSGNTNKKS